MEYILINESKLKVMLDVNELEGRCLEASSLDYVDPEAKRLFGDILSHAKDELGFDTSGYRVLLQVYPSKDGGCELFITKLSKLDQSGSECPDGKKQISTDENKCKEKMKHKKETHERAFSFERLEYLISVCKRLYESGISASGAIYVNSEGTWFLTLCFDDEVYDRLFDLLPICELSFISEYGQSQDPRALSIYLGEHAKLICRDNTIATFSKL